MDDLFRNQRFVPDAKCEDLLSRRDTVTGGGGMASDHATNWRRPADNIGPLHLSTR